MQSARVKLSKTFLLSNTIAKYKPARHFLLPRAILILLFFVQYVDAQIRLPDQDITETISFYKSLNENGGIKTFQSKMPAPVKDEKIRKEILTNLPAAVFKLKIENAELTEKTKKLFEPVLRFYGREKVYDVIIFRHSTPIMFSDTGVVLVVSTGLIDRAASDDEILGYVAHEVGHEFYAQYSIYSRHLLKIVAENGREPVLSRKYLEAMALIELQCDAFAALTLNSLQYNSLSFIKGIEESGRDYPDHSYGFHPTDAQRRELIERIASKANLSVKPKLSREFTELKNSVKSFVKNF